MSGIHEGSVHRSESSRAQQCVYVPTDGDYYCGLL